MLEVVEAAFVAQSACIVWELYWKSNTKSISLVLPVIVSLDVL